MSVARKPASHRLRLGRYSELGRIYLLTTNTHGRHPLFADLHLGRLVAVSYTHLTLPTSALG